MRLILIVAAVMSSFVVISLVFFQATRKTYPGFRRWTAGVGFLTVGYLALALRGFIPDFLSILVGNVAFPLGMVLHLDGLRRFLGLSSVSKLWYAVPVMDLAATAVLYYLHDSAFWRSVVTAIAVAAPHWAMAALIFRQPVKTESIFYTVIGSLLALAGLVILARPMVAFFMPQWHLLTDSPFLLGSLVLLIVLQLGEMLSLMMLNSERVESELVQSEAELRLNVEWLGRALDEQKRAEASLKESQETYRNFFDTSRDCVFMTTLDGRLVDFNGIALEVLGYAQSQREEMLGKKVSELYANPKEREEHARIVAEMGFCKEYPVDIRKQDGTILHALITTVARRDPHGNTIGFQGTVRDITELKKADVALRESEEKFRSLFESSLDGILLTAPDGQVFDANQAACRIFDCSEQELREAGRDGVVDETDPRLTSALEERSRTGIYRGVLNFKRMNGTTFPAEISSAIFRTASGDFRANIIVRDITERKKFEEELLRSKSELEAIYEYSPVMMCVLDRERKVLYANRALVDFVKRNESELREGRACGVFGCINTLDDPRGCGYGPHCEFCPLRLAIEDTYKTGIGHRGIEYHSTLIGKDLGREVVLLGSTALIEAGDRSSVLLCLEDVTDRKRAAQEREKTLSLLRATLDSTADAILAVDTEGRLVAHNKLFMSICGIPEQVLASRQDDEALKFALDKLKYPDEFLKRVRDIYEKPEAESYDVLELGDGRILERYSLPQRIGEEIVGRVWSFRDVTDRKRREEMLQQSEDKVPNHIRKISGWTYPVRLQRSRNGMQ